MEMYHYRPKRFHRQLYKLANKSRQDWYQFVETRDDNDRLAAIVDLAPKQPWWSRWLLGQQPGTELNTAVQAIEEFLLIHAQDIGTEDAESLAMLDKQMRRMGLDEETEVRTIIHSLIESTR